MLEHNKEIVSILYKKMNGEAITTSERLKIDSWLYASKHFQNIYFDLNDPEIEKEVKKLYDHDRKSGWFKLMDRMSEENRFPSRKGLFISLITFASQLIRKTSTLRFRGARRSSRVY